MPFDFDKFPINILDIDKSRRHTALEGIICMYSEDMANPMVERMYRKEVDAVCERLENDPSVDEEYCTLFLVTANVAMTLEASVMDKIASGEDIEGMTVSPALKNSETGEQFVVKPIPKDEILSRAWRIKTDTIKEIVERISKARGYDMPDIKLSGRKTPETNAEESGRDGEFMERLKGMFGEDNVFCDDDSDCCDADCGEGHSSGGLSEIVSDDEMSVLRRQAREAIGKLIMDQVKADAKRYGVGVGDVMNNLIDANEALRNAVGDDREFSDVAGFVTDILNESARKIGCETRHSDIAGTVDGLIAEVMNHGKTGGTKSGSKGIHGKPAAEDRAKDVAAKAAPVSRRRKNASSDDGQPGKPRGRKKKTDDGRE